VSSHWQEQGMRPDGRLEMNGRPHLERYFRHHLPSLGEAERENVISQIRDILSQ
jgi:hypothetical protein